MVPSCSSTCTRTSYGASGRRSGCAPCAYLWPSLIRPTDCDARRHHVAIPVRSWRAGSVELTGRVVEDGRESATYDPARGVIVLRLPKEQRGVHFADLGLLAQLQGPTERRESSAVSAAVLIDERGGAGDSATGGFAGTLWSADGEACSDAESAVTGDAAVPFVGACYGFGSRHGGFFERFDQAFVRELCDIGAADPDHTSATERRHDRLEQERASFSADYYAAEFAGDADGNDAFSAVMAYRPWWRLYASDGLSSAHQPRGPVAELAATLTTLSLQPPDDHGTIVFDETEREEMSRLPRKTYLLDARELHEAYCALVGIVFGYAYDHRTTEGEPTVESPWTIFKLAACLCHLDTSICLPRDALICAVRRSLIYPLYRRWPLSQLVADGRWRQWRAGMQPGAAVRLRRSAQTSGRFSRLGGVRYCAASLRSAGFWNATSTTTC